MARVNVETRAIAETRFYDFCHELGFERHEGIGVLVLFWHDSQERKIVRGSKSELMRCIPLKPDRREAVLEALVSNAYISQESEESYFIHGNQKHIDALNDKKRAGQKGGIAKAKNARKSNTSKQNVADAKSAVPNAMQSKAKQFNATQVSTTQSSSVQPNALQEEKEQEDLLAVPAAHAAVTAAVKKVAKSSLLWETYAECYEERWHKGPPPRNATVNSQLMNLVRYFGEADAVKVIRHYFQMNDSFYIRNYHPVGVLVKQAHQIYSNMNTGITITDASVRRAKQSEAFQDTMTAIENGEI